MESELCKSMQCKKCNQTKMRRRIKQMRIKWNRKNRITREMGSEVSWVLAFPLPPLLSFSSFTFIITGPFYQERKRYREP